MKIERTKNTGRNMAAGTLLKIFQMFTPFVMRNLLIFHMGEEYLGLSSLFKSILEILNLAELGVGSAMVFSMYKPIAEDDEDALCALMRLYRTYYRVIGLAVALLGLALMPFLPHLVHGDVPPELSLQTLYIFYLSATVLSYWLFAYRGSILLAYQRNDVGTLITLFTQVIQFALQMVVVLYLKNYYLYVLSVLFCQILNNIIGAVISRKMYPRIKPRGDVSQEKRKDINGRIRDLFISKLGGVVLSSADTLVISSALGLSLLAIYQNYFFIVTSICGFIELLLNSMLAGIGNSMVSETEEKNYQDLKKLTFLFTALVFGCMCCFSGVFQPFITLWMGEERLLSYGMVVSFCLYFMVYELTRFFNTFKNAAGAWHQDRFRPLISAAFNLALNILTVRYIGLYGIVWSTIAALTIIEIPWLLHNIFTTVYKTERRSPYLRRLSQFMLGGFAAWGATVLLTYWIRLSPWVSFVLCGCIAVLVPCTVFLLLFRRAPEYAPALELLDRLTRHKLPIKRLYARSHEDSPSE